ncbi:MAG: MFS transporter [Pseudomonadota bacterium]|nr:MFS transporter [Pseudomonadota bacterium]
MKTEKKILSKEVISWAFYDWANSAFATTVIAGFFPIFFKSFWASNLSDVESTALLGISNSLSGFFILLFAPFLGALADITYKKKFMLIFFMLIGAVSTAAFFYIDQGNWIIAIGAYILATIGFSGGNIFYDSLIIDVSEQESRNRVSAFGYAMGYLGGGLLFVINVLMFLQPNYFGLNSQVDAVLFSFLSVAIWWSLFTTPLIKFVKEKKGENLPPFVWQAVKNSVSRVFNTFKEIRQYKNLFYFLLAYWLYMDGIDTVVRMALAFGTDIGLESSELIIALIITQFVGFPATIFFGLLAERYGLKLLLYFGIGIYISICFGGLMISSISGFYLMAGVIGLVQGGVQSVSRAVFSKMVPEGKDSEFFGFYNLVGKSAVIFGPMMVGLVSYFFSDPRAGILSLLILFIPGFLVLRIVEIKEK